MSRWAKRPLWVGFVWGAFSLQFVALDMLSPDGGAALIEQPRRLLACAGSIALCACVWSLARTHWSRIIVALIVGLVMATQAMAWHHFGTTLDVQFVDSARAAWSDVRPVLVPLGPLLLGVVVVAWVLEGLLLAMPTRPASRRVPLVLGLVAVTCLLLGPPIDRATPEVRMAAALRALVSQAPKQARANVAITSLRSTKRELPSVLLVITESIRATDYCSRPSERCDLAPEVNALLPDRLALSELRALSSFTAISVAALSSSQAQLGSREDIAQAPTFYDYLGALDAPATLHTAYLSGHHKKGVWERANVEDNIDTFMTIDMLEDIPSDRDPIVVDALERLVRTQPERLFAVLHLYGTHAPYFAASELATYAPTTQVASWSTLEPLHNQYRNAIVTQDRVLARALRAFLDTRRGPWAIIFTSDHGEAFGEHHAIHHGQNLYDEQIHVPGFIAFGGGLLSDEQEARLRQRADGPTSHADILPTVLDLYGVWDSFPMIPHRTRMLGSSLLRAEADGDRAIPMTSCSSSMPCPVNSWGMLGETHALVGQVWDPGFRCVPLDDSGRWIEWTPECDALHEASKRYFPTLPNRKPNN